MWRVWLGGRIKSGHDDREVSGKANDVREFYASTLLPLTTA